MKKIPLKIFKQQLDNMNPPISKEEKQKRIKFFLGIKFSPNIATLVLPNMGI